MSSKIILPVILIILALLVGVGVYASFANLNPLKDNKSITSVSNLPIKETTTTKASSVSSKLNSQINPYIQQPSTIIAPSPVATVQSPAVKTFSTIDLSSHNSEADCYVSVLNKVYDVTAYINQHPGGKAILKGCGKILDNVIHPGGSFTGSQIQGILKDYYIGDLK